MTRIPGPELAALRAGALVGDVSVRRYTRSGSSDGKGGTTVTTSTTPAWTDRGTMAPASAEVEAAFADRLAGRQGWLFTLPLVRRVAITDRLTVSGRNFEVVGFDTGRSFGITHRVVAVEVT